MTTPPTMKTVHSLDATERYSIERLGAMLLAHGKLARAEKLCAGLTTLDPSSWYAYYALGVIAHKKRSFTSALPYFTHAQQLAGATSFEPTLAAARAHIELSQLAEARGALSIVIQRTPQEATPHKMARALLHTIR